MSVPPLVAEVLGIIGGKTELQAIAREGTENEVSSRGPGKHHSPSSTSKNDGRLPPRQIHSQAPFVSDIE